MLFNFFPSPSNPPPIFSPFLPLDDFCGDSHVVCRRFVHCACSCVCNHSPLLTRCPKPSWAWRDFDMSDPPIIPLLKNARLAFTASRKPVSGRRPAAFPSKRSTRAQLTIAQSVRPKCVSCLGPSFLFCKQGTTLHKNCEHRVSPVEDEVDPCSFFANLGKSFLLELYKHSVLGYHNN